MSPMCTAKKNAHIFLLRQVVAFFFTLVANLTHVAPTRILSSYKYEGENKLLCFLKAQSVAFQVNY